MYSVALVLVLAAVLGNFIYYVGHPIWVSLQHRRRRRLLERTLQRIRTLRTMQPRVPGAYLNDIVKAAEDLIDVSEKGEYRLFDSHLRTFDALYEVAALTAARVQPVPHRPTSDTDTDGLTDGLSATAKQSQITDRDVPRKPDEVLPWNFGMPKEAHTNMCVSCGPLQGPGFKPSEASLETAVELIALQMYANSRNGSGLPLPYIRHKLLEVARWSYARKVEDVCLRHGTGTNTTET